MKIVVLLTDLFDAIGGIQTFNRTLVKALDKLAEEHDLSLKLLVLNDNLNSKISRGYFNNIQRIQYFPFGHCKSKFAISALHHSVDASIIVVGHVNFSPLATGVHILCSRCRIILVIYDVDPQKKLSILQQVGIKQVNHIISISAATRDKAVEYYKLNDMKFDILPCTLQPSFGKGISTKSRKELLLPPGRMILTVTRLNPLHCYKSIDQVIKAMPQVLKEVSDAFYVIVGDGEDLRRLKQLSRDEGVSERIIFTGLVSNDLLPSYYQSCDLFVLPSLNEGFGIVFLEAMYYSKPCVGARAGGIPEVIIDGETGFLTEPGDIKDLTQAILKLLNDENLSYRFGDSGKKRLEREFSYESFCKRLEKILCF